MASTTPPLVLGKKLRVQDFKQIKTPLETESVNAITSKTETESIWAIPPNKGKESVCSVPPISPESPLSLYSEEVITQKVSKN